MRVGKMIVDCHTHISCTGSANNLSHVEACEKADIAFVLAGPEEDSGKSNKQAAEYVSKYEKMAGFAVFNPLADSVDPGNIGRLVNEDGFKGFVLYCCEGGFHPMHSRAVHFYRVVEELAVPVFFHNMAPYGAKAMMEYSQPWLLDEVARTFSGLKIVIGGMGVPFVEQTVCMLAKHDNVFADLTVRPGRGWDTYNTVVRAWEAEVMDKLLFGSGYPASGIAECIETLLGFNKFTANTNLPTVPREKIRGVIERDTMSLLDI
jgi:uncharacterized protein